MTGEGRELGPPTLEFLILHLGTQALMELGELESPLPEAGQVSLPRARFTYGLLLVLREKTDGRRTEREAAVLSQVVRRVEDALGRAITIAGSGPGEAPPRPRGSGGSR